MSEIAGRMSPQVGAFYLQRPMGGSGVLACGATGVPPARATVLGAGTVGSNAARIAHALGMRVTVLNRGLAKLKHIDELFKGEVATRAASTDNIASAAGEADLLIGAVLVKGERAPTVLTEEMVSSMRPGSVIVDVAVDQGGCVATTRPTTHNDPVYIKHGVVHYAVTNMPGAYPRTSTIALTNSTLPYVRRLASLGAVRAIEKAGPLRSAVNTFRSEIVHKGLAASLGVKAGKLS